MSTTLLAWVAITCGLTLVSFRRATYGFSLYLFTFFLLPMLWWWGRPLPALRWNLFAGIIFALAVVLQYVREPLQASPPEDTSRVGKFLVAIVINATFVHLVLAPDFGISLDNYIRVLKFAALFFLILASVRNPSDFRLVLWSVVLGAAYIGYEVTINDRGNMVRGRLEGIGAAGVTDANQLASLMVTVLPLAGGLFFSGSRRDKILVAITGPLILNVILLCSSRGALLAMVLGGLSFLLTASGRARKQAAYGLGLAALAVFVLAGDPEILSRFATTFAPAEERDTSSATRLVYWSAGLRMVVDHPLGAGGDGYKRAYSSEYLSGEGIDAGARSVHNGILNEACEWGLQGWALRMLFIASAMLLARRRVRQHAAQGRNNEAVLGGCLIAAMVAFTCSSMFGDYMDDEWGYWIPALIVAYSRLSTAEAPATEPLRSAAPGRLALPHLSPRRAPAPASGTLRARG
jgi:hypothetical protein